MIKRIVVLLYMIFVLFVINCTTSHKNDTDIEADSDSDVDSDSDSDSDTDGDTDSDSDSDTDTDSDAGNKITYNFRVLYPNHNIVGQGGWQEIYIIPFNDEISGCNEFINIPRNYLIQISLEHSISILSEDVVEKQINSGRYYFVIRGKDLDCTIKWERCKDVSITEDYTDVEIELNEKSVPENCDGTCNEGICE